MIFSPIFYIEQIKWIRIVNMGHWCKWGKDNGYNVRKIIWHVCFKGIVPLKEVLCFP